MPTIDLRRGRILSLREGPGTTVTACAGAIWVTEQDSPGDVVLTPGQSFTLARLIGPQAKFVSSIKWFLPAGAYERAKMGNFGLGH